MVSTQGKVLAVAILGGLVFGWMTSFVVIDNTPLTFAFLQENRAVVAGAYWQLLTSLFVAPPPSLDALGVVDVLFNALAIVWLDKLLSGAFDPPGYYAAFLLSGLAGNLLSLFGGPAEVSFGASGGIFGLLAGAISEDIAAERRFNLALTTWFLLVLVVSSLALPQVDWLAHLGGTAVGIPIGYVLGVSRRDRIL